MDIDIFHIPGIVRRRWLYPAVCAFLCLVLAFVYVAGFKPIYTSTAQVLLDPRGLVADSGDNRQATAGGAGDAASLDSQIYVVQSSAVLGEVVDRLDLVSDPFITPAKLQAAGGRDASSAAVAGLLKHIKVEREGQSLILTISAEHPEARMAAEIANTITAVYLKQVEEARMGSVRRASSAFQAQASELRDRVVKAETAVEQFKAANGLAATGVTGLVIDQQLAGLNQQVIAARGVEEQQRAIYAQSQSLTLKDIESGSVPEALQSNTIGLLRDRYGQLLDRQAEAGTNLGANHPQLRAINAQVSAMRQTIQQELDRVRQSMKVSYDRAAANTRALQARLDGLTKTSFDSGARQVSLRQLENEAESVRTIYKAFLSRAEELSQQPTTAVNNSRVITEAVALPKSVLVLKLLILAAALLFGLMAGSVLAVLRSLFDRPVAAQPSPAMAGVGTASPRENPPVSAPLVASPLRSARQGRSQGRPAPADPPADEETVMSFSSDPEPSPIVPSETSSGAQAPVSRFDLPVIADISAAAAMTGASGSGSKDQEASPRQGSRDLSLFGRLLRPLGASEPKEAPSASFDVVYTHAVANLARFLLTCAEGKPRLMVLFLAVGRPAASAGFIGDVAQRLIDRGGGVLFAPGELRPRLGSSRSGRPSLREALQQPDRENGPLAEQIRYERITFPQSSSLGDPSGGGAQGSGYQRKAADFVLINACRTSAGELAPHLASVVDVILLVSTVEAQGGAEQQALLERLGPAADRVVGLALLETA